MASEGTERRLAAIVSADVVGYTRLMEADEVGTHARLKARYTTLVEPMIGERGGRVVKLMGDGLLAEFPSIVDAVKWAVEIQAKIGELNAEATDDHRLEYRVGVNLGDVIVDGEDIYGDGVNVAARVQEIAERGGVCISEKVQTEVRGKLGVEFKDGGAQVLKNVTDPVRIWRWSPSQVEASGAVAQTHAGEPLPLPDKPSIAVLPFENMSGDPEQEYFADGITEDIITDLSKISGLFVIARTSTLRYKAKAVDVREISRDLGVRYVVEGSVRKAADTVRISAQLINATTGEHLWAERYDRPLSGIFTIQDEISQKVTSQLSVTLTEDERTRTARTYTPKPEAHDAYLRGMSIFVPPTAKNLVDGGALFEEAIALDPNFVGGYNGLSLTHCLSFVTGQSDASQEDMEIAVQLSEKAIEVDDTSPLGYLCLTYARLYNRQHEDAEAAITEALKLAPGDAWIRAIFARVLQFTGRPDQAIEQAKQAMRASPYDMRITFVLGGAYRATGQIAKAIETLELRRRQISGIDPNPELQLAATYMLAGRDTDAQATVKKVLEVAPQYDSEIARRGAPYKRTEDMQQYLDALHDAGLPA